MSTFAVYVHGEKWPLLHVHAETIDAALAIAGRRLRDEDERRRAGGGSRLYASHASGGGWSVLDDVRVVLMPGDRS